MEFTDQTVGNIGLYFVCYRLSWYGWNVLPTSRNAKGVDILAYNQDGTRTVTFQVKALSKRNAVPLGKSITKFMAEFLIVCRYVRREKLEYFVLSRADVERLRKRSGKDDKQSFWINPPEYEAPEFLENWTKIDLPVA